MKECRNNTLKVQDLSTAPVAQSVPVNGKSRLPKAKSPVPMAPGTRPPLTRVEAKVDVGWGNLLYIRGEGAGLSWEKGAPLACRDASTWVWDAAVVGSKVRFKLLINDAIWSGGDDQVVEPGAMLEVKPAFPCWAR